MNFVRGVLHPGIVALTAVLVPPLCSQDWSVAKTIAVGEKPDHAAMSPDGRKLYVSNERSGTVSVIDTEEGKITATVPVGDNPGVILVSHDGRSVYVLVHGALAIVDTASLWKVAHVSVPGRTDELALTPDDRRLYMTRVYDGVWYLDIETGELQEAIPDRCPTGIAISGNGQRLYVNYQCFGPGGWMAHDALAVYDLPSHRRVGVARGLANVGGQLALSPDGTEVWAQGEDACSRPDYPHEGCPTVPSRVVNVLHASDDLTPIKPIGLSLDDWNGRISFAPDGEAFIAGGVRIKRIRSRNLDEIKRIPISSTGEIVFESGGRTAYATISDRNTVDVLVRTEAPAQPQPGSTSALTLSAVTEMLLQVNCADVTNLRGDTLRKLAARLGIAGAATRSEQELAGEIVKAQEGQFSCGSDAGAFALTPQRIASELATRGVIPRDPGKPVEKLEPGGDPWCFVAERLLSSDLTEALQILTRKKNEEYREFSGTQQNPGDASEQLVDITGRLQRRPGLVSKYLTNAVYLSTLVCPNLVATVLIRQDPEQPILAIARDATGKPVTGAKLRTLVDRFVQELRNPCSNPLPDAKLLYDMLIPPEIENAIDAARNRVRTGRKLTLVWELSDELRYVPMAALSWDGRDYLAKRYNNVVVLDTSAPNAGAELEGFRALAAGDSNQDRRDSLSAIPMVRSELDQVFYPAGGTQAASRIPATILLDDGSPPQVRQFTSDTFRDSLRELHAGTGDEKLIVHIASHFILSDTPERSWVLTRSGRLSLADFADKARLPLYGVWLIAFSACDTATGPAGHPHDGREVEGLGYTADRSGAYSVLASLWEVDDASTSTLMKYFYGALQEPRTSKAAALNQAEVRFLNGAGGGSPATGAAARTACSANYPDPYMHPYYWAPFILIGSWN